MPTNEERRECAKKLREIEFKNNFFSPWCKAVETILDGKDCGEDDGTCNEDECCKRFLKEIADLIEPEPERTCEILHDDNLSEQYGGPMARCSYCGAALPEEFIGPYYYCPCCGSKNKVVCDAN